MRFAFAGTPEFGAQVLRDLVEGGRRPVLVVSQPGRPAGRGRACTDPPVATVAAGLGLPVVQSPDVNDPALAESLREAGAETLVVAAFGQVLRAHLLDAFLCLNVHPSLLPAYRGAAPIVRTLMAGETSSGVSIMRMTPGLDEGAWALRQSLSISPWDDAGSLGRALALLGATGMGQVMQGLEEGTVRWTDQQGVPSFAPKVGVADRLLDPRLDAGRLHDRVRALSPAIGCDGRTEGGLSFKVWRSFPRDGGPSGEVGRMAVDGGRLLLGCASGSLEVLTVQPAGKRSMRTPDFLRGYGDRLHDRLVYPPGPGEEGT